MFVREVSGKTLPSGKSKISMLGWLCKSSVYKNIFLSGFYFCSLSKTNIHQKTGKKKTLLRETNFLWQESHLIFWPITVPLVGTRIPCANCQLTHHHLDTCSLCTRPMAEMLTEQSLVTVCLHKALRSASSLFPKCVYTEMSLFRVSF